MDCLFLIEKYLWKHTQYSCFIYLYFHDKLVFYGTKYVSRNETAIYTTVLTVNNGPTFESSFYDRRPEEIRSQSQRSAEFSTQSHGTAMCLCHLGTRLEIWLLRSQLPTNSPHEQLQRSGQVCNCDSSVSQIHFLPLFLFWVHARLWLCWVGRCYHDHVCPFDHFGVLWTIFWHDATIKHFYQPTENFDGELFFDHKN